MKSRFTPMLDKKDIAIMVAMTLVYLMLALYNLGSMKSPETSWKPAVSGESFTLDLGREVALSRVYAHFGLGKGEYRLEYADKGGSFTPLCTITADNYNDVFKWKYTAVNARADRIRITSSIPSGASGPVTNELGIFETGSKTAISGFRITDIKADPKDTGKVENLFDEQQIIPYEPSFMDNTYFDEIYHARTAFEQIHRIEPYESTHPPLGKLFIALGILIFGMDPFGWRIVGTLFGAAMIPAMYIFGKKLFEKRFYAFCSAFLMMFDFMHFSQTRIATIDVYVTFFVILMFYYMYDYYSNKSYLLPFRQSLKPLLLSGLFFGLGAASKWIALYGVAGLAFLFFLTKYNEYKDYRLIKDSNREVKPSWIKRFISLYVVRTSLYCVLFFIVIPAAIYILSYIPFMMVPGPGHGLKDIWPYQVNMFNYHKNLVATHDFASPWWQWPFIIRPLWLYGGTGLEPGKASTMVTMGNPAVWWAGFVAVFASIYIAIKKHDKKVIVILAAIAAQYLPWVLVPRLTFIYHYFSIVPFIILAIVYVIKYILEKYPGAKNYVYAYLAVTALLFVWFYPALSGMEVGSSYINLLRWLPSWAF